MTRSSAGDLDASICPEAPTTEKAAIDRLWERFLDRARNNGVKEAALRRHVRRAEQYLKAIAGKRLAAHSAADVAGYLEEVGRKDGILDWQFVQIVDAIQNLLLTAGLPLADEVDWTYWRDSARALETSHPTIAREGGLQGDEPVSGARLKEIKQCAFGVGCGSKGSRTVARAPGHGDPPQKILDSNGAGL